MTEAGPDAAAPSHGPRPLGKTGLTASPLAWGMWRLKGGDARAARTLVETALETGLTLFDTADVYGPDNGEPFGAAEALLGEVLAEAPALRGKMTLASKGGIELGTPYNSGRDYLVSACEASLRRLRTDHIDLYQIHRPDLLAHPAEVAGALDALRAAGKIREVGVSNHTPAQTAALQAFLPFPLASVQPEFSPLAIDALSDGVIDQAMTLGCAVLAWSPLGGGRIAAPAHGDPRAAAVAAALDRYAGSRGVSRAVAAYAWILAHPARPIPIVGSQRPERIREAAGALALGYARSKWYEVLTAARGAPLP